MPVLAGYDLTPSDNLRVEVAFSTAPDAAAPAWVDLTSRLDLAAGVSVTRGRADEFSVVQPSTCSLTLNNLDGALTAGNAGSALYPNVLPARRIRVSYRALDVPGNLLDEESASFAGGTVGGWGGVGSVAVAGSATHPHSGSFGLRIAWATAVFGDAQVSLSGLVIGRTYSASAWVWVPTGSPNVFLSVFGVSSGSATAVKDAFAQVTHTFVATANTHLLQVWASGATTAGQLCYVDDIRFDEGTNATDFTLDPPRIQYRFTGYVEEWPVEWPNGGSYSQAQVTATDRLSRVGLQRPMRSVIEEAILADTPVAYYPLGEPVESTAAGDVSGAAGATPLYVQVVGSGAASTLEFGTATGPPTDALPAPTFAPTSPTVGRFLTGGIPNQGLIYPMTLSAAFLTSSASAQIVAQMRGDYGSVFRLAIDATGKLQASSIRALSGGVAEFTITSAGSFADGATHFAEVSMSLSAGTITADLFADGALVGSSSWAAGGMAIYNRLDVGGNDAGSLFTGTLSHIAVHSATTTLVVHQERATATTTGFEGDSSDERIARYASWAGFADADMALDAGSSTSICFTDTTGQSVLQAMQDVAQTEGGRLFIDGAGVLTFHARSRTYDNPAAAASVDAHLLGPDAQFVMSTQGLVNDATGQRPTGPVVRVFDAGSVKDYGVFSQSLTLLVTSDTEVVDALNWRVGGNSQPMVRVPRGTFDMYTDSTGYQAQLRGLELGDRVTVTGLPSQAPSTSVDLVLEGYTESISLTGWSLSANLANYAAVQALVLDDPVYGLLDGDNRLIY